MACYSAQVAEVVGIVKAALINRAEKAAAEASSEEEDDDDDDDDVEV